MAQKPACTSGLMTTLTWLSIEEDDVALLDDIHAISSQALIARNDNTKLFALSNVGSYLFVLKLSVHFCRLHEDVVRDPA